MNGRGNMHYEGKIQSVEYSDNLGTLTFTVNYYVVRVREPILESESLRLIPSSESWRKVLPALCTI